MQYCGKVSQLDCFSSSFSPKRNTHRFIIFLRLQVKETSKNCFKLKKTAKF